jgi:hypothetical protein
MKRCSFKNEKSGFKNERIEKSPIMENKSKLRQAIYDPETSEIVRDEEFKPHRKRLSTDVFCLEFMKTTAKANLNINSAMRMVIIQMNKKDNRLYLDSYIRDQIAKFLECSRNVVDLAIYNLLKQDVIMKLDQCYYFVNPYYFTKANKNNVKKMQLEWGNFQAIKAARAKVKKIIKVPQELPANTYPLPVTRQAQ